MSTVKKIIFGTVLEGDGLATKKDLSSGAWETRRKSRFSEKGGPENFRRQEKFTIPSSEIWGLGVPFWVRKEEDPPQRKAV